MVLILYGSLKTAYGTEVEMKLTIFAAESAGTC